MRAPLHLPVQTSPGLANYSSQSRAESLLAPQFQQPVPARRSIMCPAWRTLPHKLLPVYARPPFSARQVAGIANPIFFTGRPVIVFMILSTALFCLFVSLRSAVFTNLTYFWLASCSGEDSAGSGRALAGSEETIASMYRPNQGK